MGKNKPKWEDELIARIKGGDAIADIRKWFAQELIDAHAGLGDLSPFEEMFFNSMVYAFEAWKRQQASGAEVISVKKYKCSWKGCEADFLGVMPRGWMWLNTYWARTPHIMVYPVPAKDMSRDEVLCPRHNTELETLLVDLDH